MLIYRRSHWFFITISSFLVLAAAVGYGLQGTGAQDATPVSHSGGQEHRDHTAETPDRSQYADDFDPNASIRSLSAEEIEQIRQGGGASLALPAELNGIPGPSHVLDLTDELALSRDQLAQIQEVYDQFRADVIPAGERYLVALEALEEGFRDRTITGTSLANIVADVSRLEGDLITIHLAAHLETAELLTEEQIATYNQLRGYEVDAG